jgi:hypothetical protein
MIFENVFWGSSKAKISGKYKEIIIKAKTWMRSWEEESLGIGLIAVISMITAFAGFNFIGPAVVAATVGAGATAFQTMAIQTAVGTIFSKFATSLLVTGSL